MNSQGTRRHVPHFRHPVNLHPTTFGERLADSIAAGIGSWPFLIVQTLLVLAWIIYNSWPS